MNTHLFRMTVLVCAVIASMQPETADAQVTWTEIQLPAGTRSDLRWPVYPLDGDGLLLIHFWSDSLYYTPDSGTTWEAFALSDEDERTYPGLPEIQRCPLPFLTGNWKGLRRFDVENTRVIPETGWDSVRILDYGISENGGRRILTTLSDSKVMSRYFSDDGGNSWFPLLPGTESGGARIHSWTFVGDTLYFLTVPGFHCYACLPGSRTPSRLPFVPPDSTRMPWLLGTGLVIASFDSALVRSTDGGRSWETVRSGLPVRPFGLAHCVRSPDGTVYVLLSGLDYHRRLYRSADEGRNWTPVLCDGNPRLSSFQLTAEGEIIWYRQYERFARSSGLALTTAVSSSQRAMKPAASIYPNPLRGGEVLHIATGYAHAAVWDMRLIDLAGKEVQKATCRTDHGGRLQFPVRSAVVPGLYFLTMQSGNDRRFFPLRLLR